MPFRERIECACWEISQVEHKRNVEQHEVLVKYSPMWQALFLWRQSNMSLSQKKLARMLWIVTMLQVATKTAGDNTATWKPLTANQKRVNQNIHNNCGHPSREEFLRALRLSRARSQVLNFVRREFECPACAAKGHPPKPRMPAALPRTFHFNETRGVDLFEIESTDGTKITFCNMVCWGTLCRLCIHILDKTAATVSKCVTERWIQYLVHRW